MHSIPIMSLVALLTLTLFTINPSPHDTQAYAIEDTNARDTISTTNSNNDLDTVEREDSTVSKANNETMSLAAGDTTASLEILTGSLTEITPASTGNVSYRSHNISYSVQNPMDYTLRVSYASGNRALQYYGPNGTTVSTAGTTISGVGDGVEANNIPDNSWGFAWSDNTETANEAMTYYTMPTNNSSTGLSNGVLTSGTESIDATGKLTFAAKFASDAIAGHYKTQVLLSLAAMPHTVVYQVTYDCKGGTGCPSNMSNESTASSYQYTIPGTVPRRDGFTFLGYNTSSSATVADSDYAVGKMITLTSSNSSRTLYAVWAAPNDPVTDWNRLEYMQQMAPQACNSVSAGVAKTLVDSRDGKTYTIQRLEDNKCWMTQNLKLNLNQANLLTSSNSNVSSDWPKSALSSSTGTFTDLAANSTNPFWNDGTIKPAGGATYNEKYGYYYNWCAATAGQGRYCTGATTSIDDSRYSICPKGWRLPTKTEYDTLKDKDGGWDTKNGVNGRTLAGGFFPAAGLIGSNSLVAPGSDGNYWSSTANDSITAYDLHIASGNAGVHNDMRYQGFSVRCIAK